MPPEASAEQRRLSACEQPGSRDRDYLVYAPARRRWRPRPSLVMVLHGCKQTGADLAAATRFADWAQQGNYVAVFPSVTSWPALPMRTAHCWGFWMPEQRTRGQGEVGDLARLLDTVGAEFGCAARRRYVAGLSSGGAMAVALADAYAEKVRAASAVAGLAYAERPDAIAISEATRITLSEPDELVRGMYVPEAAGVPGPVPLQVMQSHHDGTVRIDNGRMLRDVWHARLRARGRLWRRTGRLRDWPGTRCRYRRPLGRLMLESVFFDGRREDPTHYWPGDRAWGAYAHPDGPSATSTALAFFRRHGL
jgi:poly(hydroxyalkanoate) depolymerase family esterase